MNAVCSEDDDDCDSEADVVTVAVTDDGIKFTVSDSSLHQYRSQH